MGDVRRQKLLVGTIVAALPAGELGVTARPVAAAATDCAGKHVSETAQTHAGMAAANEHHNSTHGSDLSVGEHVGHIRAECAG